ncbi:tetratricopeptide repeat protein [Candidatus Thiosymbion oneisti]|uniref:tetratricopeptide repeat protein n=2 Tax=Candidatus Thiosymbion oneisti TaxID=589554 RepID=UPI00105F6135|nr:tetratricopeptide repeat protein [Candidatus Thiosymbion oneisti]
MTRLIKVANWPGRPRGHVIFVHGLGGHPYDTWRRGKADAGFWPLWLARDIPGLCVWTLSYAAPPTNWIGNALALPDQAVPVLEHLLGEPALTTAPVTFVCHSLGGLVVKQVLREANDQRGHRPEAGMLLDRVKALVFIATPHTGSIQATWLDRLRLVAWPSPVAQDLIKNAPALRKLNVWYRNWPNEIANQVFYEAHATEAGMIVDPDGADPGLLNVVPIPIEADHIGICKPAGKDELLYTATRRFLAENIGGEDRPAEEYAAAKLETPTLPAVSRSRPKTWLPRMLRLAVLILVAVIGFKGIQAVFFPPDLLQESGIEEVLRTKYPELTPEQIERSIRSLQALRDEPRFEQAVEQAEKGNLHVAQGIWRQIYENRKHQEDKARSERAEAARNLAAIAFVENAAEGLRWYREATQLDPDNREGWLGLGEAAQATGTLEEAEAAYRKYIALARRADDKRELAVGLSGLGDVLVAEGNLPAARRAYEDSRDIRKRLAEADPSHAGRQVDLAVSHERMGDMAVRLGRTEAALAAFQAARDIYGRLLARFPEHPQFLLGSVVPDIRLAALEGAEGRAYLERALRVLTGLEAEGRLDAQRRAWIPVVESALSELDSK